MSTLLMLEFHIILKSITTIIAYVNKFSPNFLMCNYHYLHYLHVKYSHNLCCRHHKVSVVGTSGINQLYIELGKNKLFGN